LLKRAALGKPNDGWKVPPCRGPERCQSTATAPD
jgi:hypothetical protein